MKKVEKMEKKTPKFVKRLLIIVPCAIVALIVIVSCFDIVPAGFKGVKLTMGAVDGTVMKGWRSSCPLPNRSCMWTPG